MNMDKFLKHDYFRNINLNDRFFDSLKNDYKEFEDWFNSKKENKAYYFETEEGIQAFLYLKIEEEELSLFSPPLPRKKRIKIGTLKINPHGTKLGERFIKKTIDYAVANSIDELYVTVFPKHKVLVDLLEKYGFKTRANNHRDNGTEQVMIKDLYNPQGGLLERYPLVKTNNQSSWLLSIYPRYHTLLFPDSILNNESYNLIDDVSHTNSIEKIYICYMKGALKMRIGDAIVIYRTKDEKGPAEYRSVATSVCILQERKTKKDFVDFDDYYQYCKRNTVFTDEELHNLYKKENFIVLKMTYNLAMTKKLIRKSLIEDCGLERNIRWGLLPLSQFQFNKIMKLGGINESLIID
ncbi:N-acetyltransferase [Priestia endophytica]|uniref:N-acetyltransferase n=1 Tax=Priestia endophytica TaxID=135735 RepID=UPI00227E0843|nr:N-acetyltransferase [Priestia endophytica]MCY8233464.1 N-acetyltransferase [Priestia endophytica]